MIPRREAKRLLEEADHFGIERLAATADAAQAQIIFCEFPGPERHHAPQQRRHRGHIAHAVLLQKFEKAFGRRCRLATQDRNSHGNGGEIANETVPPAGIAGGPEHVGGREVHTEAHVGPGRREKVAGDRHAFGLSREPDVYKMTAGSLRLHGSGSKPSFSFPIAFRKLRSPCPTPLSPGPAMVTTATSLGWGRRLRYS